MHRRAPLPRPAASPSAAVRCGLRRPRPRSAGQEAGGLGGAAEDALPEGGPRSGGKVRARASANRHGFDLFYGMVGNTNPDGSTPLLENDGIVDPDAHVTTITEHFTRRAIDFIRRHRDRPFFIYLPHTRSHAPWMANPRFAGQSRDGVYGDMVEEIDWSTGEVMKTLDELGLTENTLVIFASDNGASPSPVHGSNAPLRGGKGSTFEGACACPASCAGPVGSLPGGRATQ